HEQRPCAWPSPLLRDLPQYELLNLARRRLRQFPEYNVARAFVSGEVLAAPGDQFLRRRGRARLELNEGACRRALCVVGLRHYGGGLHGGVPVQRILDFDGGDILATRNDDVLGAVLELDVAVRMHDAEVAGVEPAAREGLFGRGLVL